MTKKKKLMSLITLHPATPPGVTYPPSPRKLRGQRVPHGFELHHGALDLGLVPGDVVSVSQGGDGIRYVDGIRALRPGSLSLINISRAFCEHHRAEAIDRISQDLMDSGAAEVSERAGLVNAFWPVSIPTVDVEMAVDRSTSESRLPSAVLTESHRRALILRCTEFHPGDRRHHAA